MVFSDVAVTLKEINTSKEATKKYRCGTIIFNFKIIRYM